MSSSATRILPVVAGAGRDVEGSLCCPDCRGVARLGGTTSSSWSSSIVKTAIVARTMAPPIWPGEVYAGALWTRSDGRLQGRPDGSLDGQTRGRLDGSSGQVGGWRRGEPRPGFEVLAGRVAGSRGSRAERRPHRQATASPAGDGLTGRRRPPHSTGLAPPAPARPRSRTNSPRAGLWPCR